VTEGLPRTPHCRRGVDIEDKSDSCRWRLCLRTMASSRFLAGNCTACAMAAVGVLAWLPRCIIAGVPTTQGRSNLAERLANGKGPAACCHGTDRAYAGMTGGCWVLDEEEDPVLQAPQAAPTIATAEASWPSAGDSPVSCSEALRPEGMAANSCSSTYAPLLQPPQRDGLDSSTCSSCANCSSRMMPLIMCTTLGVSLWRPKQHAADTRRAPT